MASDRPLTDARRAASETLERAPPAPTTRPAAAEAAAASARAARVASSRPGPRLDPAVLERAKP